MPSTRQAVLDRQIANAVTQRDRFLASAVRTEETIERLVAEKTRRASDRFATVGYVGTLPQFQKYVDSRTKLPAAQIPVMIELLDNGLTWRNAAKTFALSPQSLQERVYRYLIDQEMLTVDIVDSIWRDSSYRWLSKIYGSPALAA